MMKRDCRNRGIRYLPAGRRVREIREIRGIRGIRHKGNMGIWKKEL
jgi:hypothetical protein